MTPEQRDRILLGWSHERLACVSGVDVTSVYLIERRGSSGPDDDARIRKALASGIAERDACNIPLVADNLNSPPNGQQASGLILQQSDRSISLHRQRKFRVVSSTPKGAAFMTPVEAAALHSRASAGGGHLTWFITLLDAENPGLAVAWVMMADHPAGGQRLPGKLVASTLEEVRAMLPAGLKRRERTAFLPDGSVEGWE